MGELERLRTRIMELESELAKNKESYSRKASVKGNS